MTDLTKLVRKLEWEDFMTEHEARSMGLAWRVYETRDGEWNSVRCAPDNHRLATGVDLAAAQAAANADHAACVIAEMDGEVLGEVVGALRPFAEHAEAYDPEEDDDQERCWVKEFTPSLGELRRARAILAKLGVTL